MAKKTTAPDIRGLKGARRLTMLTAYDFPTAKILDDVGVDMILVGDSLAMVVLGREDTLSVTVEEMLHHCRAVSAAAKRALVIADMPFLSYEAGVEQAVLNAGRMLKEGGARAVKVEGGREMLPQIAALIAAGIPVLGHLGLTPQRIAELGGFKVQGRTTEAAQAIIEDARALSRAGCFAIVIECIPADLAAEITRASAAPTIGIGAGPHCDGQVLVLHDVLGLFERFVPRFVKQYAKLTPEIARAVRQFKEEVEGGVFPGQEHSFETPAGEKTRS